MIEGENQTELAVILHETTLISVFADIDISIDLTYNKTRKKHCDKRLALIRTNLRFT